MRFVQNVIFRNFLVRISIEIFVYFKSKIEIFIEMWKLKLFSGLEK